MSKISPDVLLKIQSGDPLVLTELVKTNTKLLYNACRGMGFDATTSDDLTQNVWSTFFTVAKDFHGNSTVKTFLFGILFNKASELRRSNKKAEPREDIEDLLDENFDSSGHWIQGPKDPERFLQAAQVTSLIQKCMELLPLNQKMAFTLKEVEGEETADICANLNITTSNLGVLLFRAKDQLRKCIEHKSGARIV